MLHGPLIGLACLRVEYCCLRIPVTTALPDSATTNTTLNQTTTRHASDQGPEETQLVQAGVKKQGDTHVADNIPSLARKAVSPPRPAQVQPARYHHSSIYWIQPRPRFDLFNCPERPCQPFPSLSRTVAAMTNALVVCRLPPQRAAG
jgi:hypothetical protein